jgi:hypothetical protein
MKGREECREQPPSKPRRALSPHDDWRPGHGETLRARSCETLVRSPSQLEKVRWRARSWTELDREAEECATAAGPGRLFFPATSTCSTKSHHRMSSGGIEMDNLSGPKTNLSRVIPESTPSLTSNAQDRVVAAWTFTAAALCVCSARVLRRVTDVEAHLSLFLIASLLTLAPRFLLFASTAADEERRNALSPLEAFLALHFGVFLYAIVAALVFNVRLFSRFAIAVF